MKSNKMSPPQMIVISFLLTIIIGSLILHLPIATVDGKGLSIVDSIFTATSATCVTGLTVVSTAHELSLLGQLTVLFLIQLGGLGLMTFATIIVILLGKRVSLRRRLVMLEALNQFSLAGLIKLTKYILIFSLLTEFVGMLLLSIKWYPLFGIKGFYYGLFHSISAFNNAGFDLFGNSLIYFRDSWYINIVILTLFIGGGLGFTVIAEIYDKGIKKIGTYSLHSKIVLFFTIVLLIIGFLAVFIIEYNNPQTLGSLSLNEKIVAALFQGATPRTAGFNTLAIPDLKIPTLLIIIFLMFIGASPASTGGGVKTTSFGVILFAVFTIIKGKEETVVFKRKIPVSIILKALAVISIGILMISSVLMIMTILEDAPFLDLVFEVVSAFGTVGLSTGITSHLSSGGKILIIASMFMGRVGPLTLFFALTKRKKEVKIGYPEEKVIVG